MWYLDILLLSVIADGARFTTSGPVWDKGKIDPLHDPEPTLSGYLTVDQKGSELFFAYWEASESEDSVPEGQHGTQVPIVLWLQVN